MTINMRIPTDKEWDKMMDICHEMDDLTHWENMFSWVNDGEVHELKESYRASRGYVSARIWSYYSASYQNPYLGFRPAFDNLTTDVSATKVIGTLYMDGFPIQVPCNPTDWGDIQDYIPGTKLEVREPLDDPRYQVRAIRVGNAYIADRVLLKNISYEDIEQVLDMKTPGITEAPHNTPNEEIRLSTPHGILRACISNDDEFPGIRIELEKGQNYADNITLALVEYIPGGEALSDYDPSNPALMAQQSREVPESRRMVKENGQACVTAGFVTRTWPHERLDESLHYRTFHDVYEDADLTYTTCDENGNLQTTTHYHPPIIATWKTSASGYVGTGKTREAADADLVQKVEAATEYRGLTMIAKKLGYSVYAVDTDGYCYPMDAATHQGVFDYADGGTKLHLPGISQYA